MKKILSLCLLLVLLAGCGAQTPETTQPPTQTVPEFTGQAPVETESNVQFGGVFGLYLNGDEVTVNLPGQFAGQLLDQSCMGAYSDDQLSFLTYTLSDADLEDLKLSIEEEAYNARQSGWYKSHGMGEEIGGFTTMYILYDDSTYSYYAWKELESSVLFLSAELDDSDLTLEELIASVEIVGE